MSHDRKIVDLIGEQELKASESVQVRQITNQKYEIYIEHTY